MGACCSSDADHPVVMTETMPERKAAAEAAAKEEAEAPLKKAEAAATAASEATKQAQAVAEDARTAQEQAERKAEAARIQAQAEADAIRAEAAEEVAAARKQAEEATVKAAAEVQAARMAQEKAEAKAKQQEEEAQAAKAKALADAENVRAAAEVEAAKAQAAAEAEAAAKADLDVQLAEAEIQRIANEAEAVRAAEEAASTEEAQAVAKTGELLFSNLGSDDKITWSEFATTVERVGWKSEVALQLWYESDTDHSGVLDRAEFLRFCHRPDVEPHVREMERDQARHAPGTGPTLSTGERLFADIGADGMVTWVEFSETVESVGWEMAVARQFWYETDVDRSGSLDKSEFLTFCGRPGVERYIRQAEEDKAPAVGVRLYKSVSANGQVAWEKFGPLMEEIGWPLDVAHRMWNETDHDKSGLLNEVEFLSFCQRADVREYILTTEAAMPGGPQVVLGDKLFKDLDGKSGLDGRIQWTDFLPAITSVGWDHATAQHMWQQTDTDKSGNLERAEFLRFCLQPSVSAYIFRMETQL